MTTLDVDVRELAGISDDVLQALLFDQPLVVLVGSGVSRWGPTALPTGVALTANIPRFLFGADPTYSGESWASILERTLAQTPLEVMTDCCPDELGLRRELKLLFDVRVPNGVHEAVARAARQKRPIPPPR